MFNNNNNNKNNDKCYTVRKLLNDEDHLPDG
jgi:hypothetical protein